VPDGIPLVLGQKTPRWHLWDGQGIRSTNFAGLLPSRCVKAYWFSKRGRWGGGRLGVVGEDEVGLYLERAIISSGTGVQTSASFEKGPRGSTETTRSDGP